MRKAESAKRNASKAQQYSELELKYQETFSDFEKHFRSMRRPSNYGARFLTKPRTWYLSGRLMYYSLKRARNRSLVTSERVADMEPPVGAELILLVLLRSKRASNMIGDLREKFGKNCRKLGREEAVRLYRRAVLRTIVPLTVRGIERAVGWGAVAATIWRYWRG